MSIDRISLRRALGFAALPLRERVLLPGRGSIYILSQDARGRRIRRAAGATQPHVTLAWRAISRHLRPQLLLDIGANHGEVSLAHHYATRCRLVLVEPSPLLAPVLAKSIAARRDRVMVDLIPAVVTDDQVDTIPFYTDLKWSGTSSAAMPPIDEAFKGPGTQRYRSDEIPTTTGRALLGESAATSRVLIKIDTEGFDAKVVRSFGDGLADRQWAALVECEPANLIAAGSSARQLFDSLQQHEGHVYRLARSGRLERLLAPPVDGAELFATNVSTLPGEVQRMTALARLL